jgi:glucose-1-phosphate thymidylyltransferase
MPSWGVVVFGDTPGQNGRSFGSTHVPGLEYVANRPIAHHVLDALLAAGVEHVVVSGPSDLLIDVRASLAHYGVRLPRLEYAICPERSDTVTALRAAAPFIGAAPCVVHFGDGLLSEPLRTHIDFLHRNSLDLILLAPAPATNGSATAFSRTQPDAPRGEGDAAGEAAIAVFGPGALQDACHSSQEPQPLALEGIAHRLADQGRHVQVCAAAGWRRYQGNPKDLLEVNRLALDRLVPRPRLDEEPENRIEGCVHIDPTASVTASVIVGPVIVGEGAEIENAYIGPYTSIGAGARIEGVEIERSIISPGASVTHVGARLVSSLVGRGAHVFRDFSLPRAMRLRVGEGDEIALC